MLYSLILCVLLLQQYGENTTMKKSIIVIALALLALASVFAKTATPKDSSTTAVSDNVTTIVELTLTKTPTYIFGIKEGAFTAEKITKNDVPSTTIENTDKIYFKRYTASEGNILDVKAVDGYYLSYLFYEYDDVTFSMSLSGNMKNTTTTSSKSEIEYLVTVGSDSPVDNDQDGNTTSLTQGKLDSSDSSMLTWSTKLDKTEKLGQYRWASLQLTIEPKNTSSTGSKVPTLKGIDEGTYQSTITLKVEAK